jgi:hypothetical protein
MPAFIGAGILCLMGAGLVLLINRDQRRGTLATA